MEVKSTEWRPGPTVCRCCLSEGCYKDISTEYFWMGKREVYAEMLSETFDVTIAFSKSGGPNSNSRLICEPCISRLRDASEFKRQVLECEKTFMQHLDPGTSTSTDLDISVDTEKEVKLERIKTEKRLSDDDFDDHGGFDDDDDDLDDEPLTKLASKVPKKESVDLLDLLDNAKVAEKRKSTTKTKSTPAKKSKKETIQPTPSKTVKIEKKKKDVTRHDPARRNAELIIKYTTARPFRVNVKSVLCVYCGDLYDDPTLFRAHMNDEHATFSLFMAFAKLPKKEFVKIDVTNLCCRICKQSYANLNQIAAHLRETHRKAICLNSQFGVMPYTLDKDRWCCAVCAKSLPSLLHLNKHTITHFLNYVCDICGKSYIATTGLLQHVRSKHENDYKAYCRRCRKVFPSMEAKNQHQKTEKSCMRHCCVECPERFPTWEAKQRHMVEMHAIEKKSYHCSDCDVITSDRRVFYDHFKMCHSQDCLVCAHCGMKFSTNSRLNRHLGKHVQ